MLLLRDGGPAYRQPVAPCLFMLLCLLLLSANGALPLRFRRPVLSSSVSAAGDKRGLAVQRDGSVWVIALPVADVAEVPNLLISEVMVAPLAVTDKRGEWC